MRRARRSPGLLHLADVAIAGGFEAALFRAEIETLAQFEQQCRSADEAARRQALHQRRNRHDEHAARRGRKAVERGDALRHDFRVGRKQVVRQGFPIRKMQHIDRVSRIGGAGEDAQVGFERMRRLRIAHDRDNDAGVRARGLGDRQRSSAAVRRVPEAALLRFARQRWMH